MNDTWLKIKAWTKGILIGAVVLYLALFVFKNTGHEFVLWWWFGYTHQFDMLFLSLVSFAAGAVCAILIGTTWRTMRQIRDVRDTRRQDKQDREQSRQERENADVRAKAAMLHTVPPTTAPAVAVRVDAVDGGN